MSNVEYAESTENLVIPAYRNDFEKALETIRGQGFTVKRIWGNCIYTLKNGTETVWSPEKGKNGFEFVPKHNLPVAKEA
jgi:hypothetical protein